MEADEAEGEGNTHERLPEHGQPLPAASDVVEFDDRPFLLLPERLLGRDPPLDVLLACVDPDQETQETAPRDGDGEQGQDDREIYIGQFQRRRQRGGGREAIDECRLVDRDVVC